MRILHVVTLVSADAAMGGVMRVALHQCRALADLGHDVVLAAVGRGFGDDVPTDFMDVPVRLFPEQRLAGRLGMSGLRGRGMDRWLRRHAGDFDVVHLHVTRDLVTLPAARHARRAGVPYVLQPHGQIDPSDRLLARIYDPLITRRELRRAPLVLCITAQEAGPIEEVAGAPVRWRELPNAVDDRLSSLEAADEVLFLARLAPRKRPVEFALAAAAVAPRAPGWRFAVVGPDEGERAAVEAVVARTGAPVVVEGPLEPAGVPDRMRRCAVYVLPALDEPFGLTVIEAMVQERPVVVVDDCGLADVVRDHEAGLVVDPSVESLERAVQTLVDDPALRERMGRNGRRVVLERYTTEAAAKRLLGCYEEVVR